MVEANPQSPRWSGLLMAGGQSRRMGRDKAMLPVHGEPLWRRQWRTLREAGAEEVMISRGNQEWAGGERGREAEERGAEKTRKQSEGVLDPIPDAEPGCGPLGGLVAGLRRLEAPWLIVLAVDLPRMTARFLRALSEQAAREGRGMAPVREGRYEPLAAVYPKGCLGLAEQVLAAGEWSLQSLVRRCVKEGLMREVEVAGEEREYFCNVNTIEEWAAVLGQLTPSL